jgi:hypothetical protein
MSGSILETAERSVFQLGFECSPIIFTGGIAADYGGYLPVIALTEGANRLGTLIAGASPFNLDNFLAHFQPMPGGRLANFSIGQYPFANQSVAANAIISEPLNISLRMIIPANKPGAYKTRFVTMMMLQAAVQKHANLGGTYTVVTPAHLYTDCILTNLVDVSSGGAAQNIQDAWQWDFIQPLVTLAAAQAAMSTLMQKLNDGTPTSGTWNATASSGAVPSTVPSALPTGMGVTSSPAPGFG